MDSNRILEAVHKQAARDSQLSEGNYYNAVNQGISTFNTGTVHFAAGANVHPDDSRALRQLRAYSILAAIHSNAREVGFQHVCPPGHDPTLDVIESLASSSPDLIWLRGPAGAGKSALMRAIATRLDNEGTFLGSFFFFRSEPERNNSTSLFPTIALQASLNIPQVQRHIAESIRQNPMFPSQPTHIQCIHLLETPLVNLLSAPDVSCGWTSTSPRVLVIDGLDECVDGMDQSDTITALRRLASTIRDKTKCRIKILIASRPEHAIKAAFSRLDDLTVIPLGESNVDLRSFYIQRFEQIRKKHALPRGWPSEDEFKWLIQTNKTPGRYSFAEIFTRHLAAKDSVHRFQTIRQAIGNKHGDKHDEDSWHLDILYTTILQQIPSEMLQPALFLLRLRLGAQPGWRDNYLSVLHVLLQISPGFLSDISPYLSSLINFDRNLRPYHTSLSDFLHDPQRSGPLAFEPRETLFSQALTKGLLELTSVKRWIGSIDAKEATPSLLLYLERATLPKTTTLSRPDPENDPSKIVKLVGAVDVPSFHLWTFSYFARLCGVLRALYAGTTTGSVASQLLTRRMKEIWRKKATVYAQCCGADNVAELVIGLLFLSLTATHRNYLTSSVVAGLVKYIIQSKRGLSEVDRTVGWNVLDALPMLEPGGVSTDPNLFFDPILQYEDVSYTSQCLQVVFDATLKVEDGKSIHPLVDEYVCNGMVGSLVELQLCIVQCWSSTQCPTTRVPTLEHLDTLFCFIQSRDWVQRSLINAVIFYVQRILHSRPFCLTPAFASPQKRKLATMLIELTVRAKYLAELG